MRRFTAGGSSLTIAQDSLLSSLTHTCSCIKDFLTNRPQTVKLGSLLSSTPTLSASSLQGWLLSPLLYSLYTSDCRPAHSSNTIIQIGWCRLDEWISGMVQKVQPALNYWMQQYKCMFQVCLCSGLMLLPILPLSSTPPTPHGSRVVWRVWRILVMRGSLLLNRLLWENPCREFNSSQHQQCSFTGPDVQKNTQYKQL